MKIDVTLDAREMLLGVMAGGMMNVHAIKNHIKDNERYKGERRKGWEYVIESAMSEIALAKALNQCWQMCVLSARHIDDVGIGNEARWTRHANGHLTVYRDDKDEHNYFLVTGRNGVYRIHGYVTGANAKQERWWKTESDELNGSPVRAAAYFVPQSEIIELSEDL